MMESVKSWLLGIILTAFAVGLARQLAPERREATMVRLAGSLLLALAILRPLRDVDWTSLALPVDNLSVQSTAEELRQQQSEEFSAIIAEKTAAYIWEKASALGIDCRVTVSVTISESGIPLPCSVTLQGRYDQTLSDWLEDELGLTTADQNWLEEGKWNTKNASEN